MEHKIISKYADIIQISQKENAEITISAAIRYFVLFYYYLYTIILPQNDHKILILRATFYISNQNFNKSDLILRDKYFIFLTNCFTIKIINLNLILREFIRFNQIIYIS